MKQALAMGIAIVSCTACCGNRASTYGPGPGDMSSSQKDVYEACLQRDMAVAMAWEIIEERCAQEALGRSGR